MKKKGFTLVEMLLSIAVSSIIGGVVVATLKYGFDAWAFSAERLMLQKATNNLITYLVDGGYDSEGVRDLVELKSAGADSIAFSTLWHDTSQKPDPMGNKEQEFILNRQFKVGSSIPMGQIKEFGADSYASVPIEFTYGEGSDPKKLDDVIKFIDPIPANAQIKIIFTPDADADPTIQKRFSWDPVSKGVYETYNKVTKDLLGKDRATKIYNLSFMYYDNLNQPIQAQGGSLSVENLKRVTGVKIYLFAARKHEWIETTTYTNIRNVSSIGMSIIAGSEVPMPISEKMRGFSIGNFYGGSAKDNVITLIAVPEKGKSWSITLKISKGDEGDLMMVDYFQMEYPPGTVISSGYVEQSFHADEFVNLLTLDRTGRGDYDLDTNINDFVNVEHGPVILKVQRCDFDGAQLFVRP